MKREMNRKQQWSTIPSISTKLIVTSYLNSLNTKNERRGTPTL
jgi:hypothetical protein